MAGVCLGGAALNVPVVVDGFIATAAAVAAERLSPGLFAHLLFGHRSVRGRPRAGARETRRAADRRP